MPKVHVRLLGSIEVVGPNGELIASGRLKQRIVLACLAVDSGRIVSTDSLIDALWDELPPRSALATLQGLVHGLRQTLGHDVIQSVAPGYRLASDIVTTDVEQLIAAIHSDDFDALDVALRSVRGDVLGDLVLTSAVAGMRAKIEQTRLRALERWCDLAIPAGRVNEVIQRLEVELGRHPWHEALWERLMVALYVSRRQADALRAYETVRTRLREELGLDPGPELRATQERILNHDPSLLRFAPQSIDMRTPQAQPAAARGTSGGHRAGTLPLRGRVAERNRLRSRLASDLGTVSMVLGEPGMGKTRLLDEVAEDVWANGAIVLRGSCPEGSWAVPYAPLVQAIDYYVQSFVPEVSRRKFLPYAEALGPVSKAMRSLRLQPHRRPLDDTTERRFEIFDGFRRFFADSAALQPVVLVLDDLHWLDPATAAALSTCYRPSTRRPSTSSGATATARSTSTMS